jgi:hypothetical protein
MQPVSRFCRTSHRRFARVCHARLGSLSGSLMSLAARGPAGPDDETVMAPQAASLRLFLATRSARRAREDTTTLKEGDDDGDGATTTRTTPWRPSPSLVRAPSPRHRRRPLAPPLSVVGLIAKDYSASPLSSLPWVDKLCFD